MMRTLTYGLVGLFLLSPLGEAAIDTDFLQQSWSRQWVRHVEVGRHQVRWRQRASRTDGIFAGVRFEVPLDRQAVWERSNDYTDLSTMTPGVTAVRWIERQEHRQVLQVDVKVLWKRLTLTFEVEQDPPTAMRFRLVHPIVGEYRGLCVFEASAAPKAGSPAFAVSPWRQPGEEGEAGVAAKPGRQGTGEAEHGFGAVPPHGRQQGPRASARGAPPQSPGTVVELM
ncbi:MAG: SRPBCC family protein, partial [Candidatus Omnitrophota bacterium]|nr:SRPBCC family protein [Candidatus Omnitrophota bacterium]